MPVSNGVQISVRLTPKARHNLVEGVIVRSDGTGVLKVRVTAAPEKGNANEALLDLLASAWRLRKTQLSIRTGMKSRNKIVLITGDPAALLTLLGA